MHIRAFVLFRVFFYGRAIQRSSDSEIFKSPGFPADLNSVFERTSIHAANPDIFAIKHSRFPVDVNT